MHAHSSMLPWGLPIIVATVLLDLARAYVFIPASDADSEISMDDGPVRDDIIPNRDSPIPSSMI